MTDNVELLGLQADIDKLISEIERLQKTLNVAVAQVEELHADLAHANEQCDIFVRVINDQAAEITRLTNEITQLQSSKIPN